MHVFGIVLEDGEGGFFEDEHPRYLFLYDELLTETAQKLQVSPLKAFDGFAQAEIIANEKSDPSDTIAWLSAYNDARDEIEPLWFEPEDALVCVNAVKEAIEKALSENPDDDIEYLVESLDVLVEILDSAVGRKTRFFMALM